MLDSSQLRTKEILTDAEWDAKKQTWRAVLLSLPARFTEMTSQEIWRNAFNRRQAVLQEHESLSRTALQAACELSHLKCLVEAQHANRGKLSAQALSTELLKLGLQQVTSGSGTKDEDDQETGSLSATFAAQALNVHENVVSQPRLDGPRGAVWEQIPIPPNDETARPGCQAIVGQKPRMDTGMPARPSGPPNDKTRRCDKGNAHW